MHLLKSTVHPELKGITGRIFKRRAARGIIFNEDNILLLYTERYHDFTLPGGGIDDGEDIVAGLIRELQEETGAKNIRDIEALGLYEEYRPCQLPGYDILHMQSYCYFCKVDDDFGDTQLESYEIQNGMKPVWVNIHEAIAHNEDTMKNSVKKGMSIERETFLLKLIVKKYIYR
jgi:8-oxo-dGTP pyrophosphatase MutT (NUDIX family)